MIEPQTLCIPGKAASTVVEEAVHELLALGVIFVGATVNDEAPCPEPIFFKNPFNVFCSVVISAQKRCPFGLVYGIDR